jgi:hypothetical protein
MHRQPSKLELEHYLLLLNPGAVVGVSNVISVNDTVVVLDPVTGLEAKGIVTASTLGAAGTITIQPFAGTTLTAQGFSADWY